MPTYHILNGDCLADQLTQTSLNQENFIPCRECLIEGSVQASSLSEFWAGRAAFIAETAAVSTEEYFRKTVQEFEKIQHLPADAEVCLWFENDLFCQTNMWFVLSLLSEKPTLQVYRIFPIIHDPADTWKGFGIATPTLLMQSYANRVKFTAEDIQLGKDLWTAYTQADFAHLRKLSQKPSACFAYLEDVCQAHIDRFPVSQTMGRPEQTVKEIMETYSQEFSEVFTEFSRREGIYGLGDVQVKTLYDRHIHTF